VHLRAVIAECVAAGALSLGGLAAVATAGNAPIAASAGNAPIAASAGNAPIAASGADATQADPFAGRFVLRAAKILTCAEPGPGYVDDGVLVVADGRIAAIGTYGSFDLPADWPLLDLGQSWLMPGMIDLHCHVAGRSLFEINDLNDGIFLTNPELRASAAVVPMVDTLELGLAGGVTSVLYIPGSATNIGGQGVLLKTGFDRYEDMLLRAPGSMKLAQAGNPERWMTNPGRSFMNWNTRHTIERGMARARARAAGSPLDPLERAHPQWEIFDHLLDKSVQVSAHTQIYQVVLRTITMIKLELGIDVYLDHGTIGGWKTGALAAEAGVPAICGPRAYDTPSRLFVNITGARLDGFRGIAAGYQSLGHTQVGFNTDSPIVPEEELSLQAAVGARYGFRDDALQTVKGLTLVPARAAGIADRVGSLEVGKDADILVITGHPVDPRSSVERIWIEGVPVYDAASERRRW
jgi:imidazolonepropionase-like amidohydrolase